MTMAKKNIQAKKSIVRYRAVCNDDTFKGPWRLNEEDAYRDARVHREEPGNELHLLKVIMEQTTKKNDQ